MPGQDKILCNLSLKWRDAILGDSYDILDQQAPKKVVSKGEMKRWTWSEEHWLDVNIYLIVC